MKESEIKFTYCNVKINELYLKDFTIYNDYNETNQANIECNFEFTTNRSDALDVKIEDAHYLAKFMGDGITLKYIY